MKRQSALIHKMLFFFAILAMCLLAGPAVTHAAPPEKPAVAASNGYYYTVQWGDTLSQIAVRHGTTMQAILLANPWVVNPHLIFAGTVLFIPTGVPGVIVPPAPPPAQPGCRRYHTVQWGENLIRIGAWYGVSPFAIAEANQIYNLNRIFAGQVLCIP